MSRDHGLAVRLILTAWAGVCAPAHANGATDARLLTQPAISATQIAFIYAGDLYIADLQGAPALSNVRRLTADDGVESNPVFSPDGQTLAFSAQYDGNIDVYTVPVSGGAPTRLTWHPDADLVQSFTTDGKAVLFTSPRAVFTSRNTQLFTVPVQGGAEQALPIPNAARATYSPDGLRLAYSPISPRHLQWKQYRGGAVSTLWLYDTRDHAIQRVPQPGSRANDADPIWLGDTIYFRSDRNGEFNLFAFGARDGQIRQLTRHTDFPVLNAAGAAGRIVYEQAGALHLLDLTSGTSQQLRVDVASDLRDTRPRYVKGTKWIREAALSPSGARAAFNLRGEIVTVPAEKGDARNLTASPGAHDRSPAWSPDGRSIAWFSDSSGEYRLHIGSQDGKGPARIIAVAGAGFYNQPVWSPDSRRIAYQDNSQSLYWVDVASGVSKKIAAQSLFGPTLDLGYQWSPDSQWLAYAMHDSALLTKVSVYSVAQDKAFAVSDGLSEVRDPVFDRSGKYLYFLASTDAGPVKDWFALSSTDMRATFGVYVAVLRNDELSPLAKQSDEEPPRPASAAEERPFRIDFDGIERRILDLPLAVAELSSLQTGLAGQLFYLKATDGKNALNRYDINTRKNEVVLPEVQRYIVSHDGQKLLYQNGGNWFIVPTTRKVEPAEGRIAADAVEVRVEPMLEWRQMFDEAWRINRDFFYAPNMHGVDWAKQREKYAAFLPHVTTRDDLSRIIQWMCSELTVGHHGVNGGDTRAQIATIPGGLLGADYEIAQGRYRLKKVFGGRNWNPQLRSPLTAPGVNARAGDYLLAVNGRPLRATDNIYRWFENTAEKIVDIELGPNADGTGVRNVQVTPIASEAALRNRDWVEGNLQKVEHATGGRVAYVYVPNTAAPGYQYFKRYFYPQLNRDAIIVDERFNAGGLVADYFIELLRRPFIANWAMRYGEDMRTPFASIAGPKALLIDESAGSGGDLLPWMFRKFEVGPIIGRRTWGGLVGTFGYPPLLDGGTVTAPNVAIWTPEEGWIIENEGVAPDIDVEQTPADVIAGRDPQLERAIAVVMEELAKHPVPKATRPAYPVRGKTLRGTVPSAEVSP